MRHLDNRLVRKTINVGILGDANAKREIEYMKHIKHPNVVTYIHHEYQEPKKDILKVYMPYYPNSDLHHFLSYNNPSFDERMRMFIDILVGLQQLHSRFIIHRDIKSKNIFVTEDRSCVIGDLGISTTSLDSANSQVGTYCYNAP
jgi:serine/threonine protein kinase